MPYTPAGIAKEIMANRHKISDRKQIIEFGLLLFELAIRDAEAAAIFLKENNRFITALRCLPKERLREKALQFSQSNSLELIKKLILFAGIDEKLAAEMRRKASSRGVQANQFNACLQLIQRTRLDGRTRLAVRRNIAVIEQRGAYGVNVDGEFIPMVRRKTRDFNKKLCSVGAGGREIILLDPDDVVLHRLYDELRRRVAHSSDPATVLETVKNLTRSCFPQSKPDSFIRHNIAQGNNLIPISQFILQGQGVCRHHALLNCYFLSRLVQDGVLNGAVISHRQNLGKDGAHNWNIYHDANGKVYSLDSLWNDLTCVTDNPGAIDRLYRHPVEADICQMHFVPPLKPDLEPELEQNKAAKIAQIKKTIEDTEFKVGNYFFFQGGRILTLENGSQKRVPHRVFEVYEAIKKKRGYSSNSKKTHELWEEIQRFAEQGLNNPRCGQDKSTRAFYRGIRESKGDVNPLQQNVNRL